MQRHARLKFPAKLIQTRLHHLLHGWLVVHVPASIALLIGTAWHAIAAVSFMAVPR